MEARFDTRLPKEQKEFFERAAKLGGYRTLTEFVISSLQEKAKEIVEKHEKILATEADRKKFFNAILNPPEANQAFREAAERYQKSLEY